MTPLIRHAFNLTGPFEHKSPNSHAAQRTHEGECSGNSLFNHPEVRSNQAQQEQERIKKEQRMGVNDCWRLKGERVITNTRFLYNKQYSVFRGDENEEAQFWGDGYRFSKGGFFFGGKEIEKVSVYE